MTTKPLHRFWKALDEIPEATTDRREWALRLGDDWPVAAVYLTPVGRLAKEIACSSPGGDGCPRKIVKHANARFRAVCGNQPAQCDSIDLTVEEITCLALDRPKLAAAVAAILSAEPEPDPLRTCAAMVIGSHRVAAGVGIPVILMIPGPMEGTSADALTDLGAGARPVALVVPTPRSTSKTFKAAVAAQGHTILSLTEISTAKDCRLVGVGSAEALLTELRDKLLVGLTPTIPGRTWVLPADARWEELVFDFTADEVVNVRFRGQTRRFEPENFGMKNAKNGRPTSAWILLRTFARGGGILTWKDQSASPTVEKQKQLLSNRLKHHFGIEGDPIPWRKAKNAYQTLFVIRHSAPVRSRHG
jgi:hypothetical protein